MPGDPRSARPTGADEGSERSGGSRTEGGEEELRDGRGDQGPRPKRRARTILRPARTLRLRKVHAPAHDRRPRGGDQRRPSISVASTSPNVPPAKRRIAMVFQSYALYPHMTVRQNISFALKVAKTAERSWSTGARMEVARMLQLERPARPQAGAAFRRPAPARRHRPGAGARAGGVPVRRAAVQSRRRAARADARRNRKLHQGSGDDDDLRHPRSGRGDDAGRQDRGARPRALSRRSARRWSSTTSRPTSSSPRSSARRR